MFCFRSAGATMMMGAASLLATTALTTSLAQQPPAQPPATPAPSAAPTTAPAWKQGMPPGMATSPLAPHAIPLTVTPPEKIPLDKIKVPAGFKAELWAHGMPGARMMARGDKGTIFVGTRAIGRIYAITEKNGRREHEIIAQGLTQPNGVAFKNGALYVAAINKVLRYDDIEDNLDGAPEPVDLSEAFNLPPDQHHGWKFLAFGPDGKLYVPVGAPCNICEVNPGMHAHIRRSNPDGSGMEIVARGVRNSVGFDFHPVTKELWFTDNGRDWMGDAGPEEELNRVTAPLVGATFGYPYCHAQGIPDPYIRRPYPCAGAIRPAALLGPHAAALGMRFYTGNMFPAEYKNSAFIARRGSWNRTQKFGYDVVVATPAGEKATVRPFMTGFLDTQENKYVGRPVDVLQMPDGALLVSDEHNGAIYRVSFSKQDLTSR
jgi:glucose/arabinose dehydrogenase